MSKIFLFFFKVLSIFIKKDKNLITIVFRGYSGSNATPIIEKMQAQNNKRYKLTKPINKLR